MKDCVDNENLKKEIRNGKRQTFATILLMSFGFSLITGYMIYITGYDILSIMPMVGILFVTYTIITYDRVDKMQRLNTLENIVNELDYAETDEERDDGLKRLSGYIRVHFNKFSKFIKERQYYDLLKDEK